MEAYSLTSWKCLKFLWQSDPEIWWVTGFLHTQFYYYDKKGSLFFFLGKNTETSLLVRVKHGWQSQNTNYNWGVCWNLLKALDWLMSPPSTSLYARWQSTSQLAQLCIPQESSQGLSAHITAHWWFFCKIMSLRKSPSCLYRALWQPVLQNKSGHSLCSVHHIVNCEVHIA